MAQRRSKQFVVPSCWCVHDDHWFLKQSIQSFRAAGPAIVIVSRTAWDGSVGHWETTVEAAKAAGAEVIIGDFPTESLHRRAALDIMRSRMAGGGHFFAVDSDEIIGLGYSGSASRLHKTTSPAP